MAVVTVVVVLADGVVVGCGISGEKTANESSGAGSAVQANSPNASQTAVTDRTVMCKPTTN